MTVLMGGTQLLQWSWVLDILQTGGVENMILFCFVWEETARCLWSCGDYYDGNRNDFFVSSQPFPARDPKLWMRRLNRRVPPSLRASVPPLKTWRAVFCPIFKPCIPLFYRRAHKCGKKGRKWGSNINLYYLISAEQPATLYWGLFTAIVTIVTGLLWFLQGNTNQQKRKMIWSDVVSFYVVLCTLWLCVCVSVCLSLVFILSFCVWGSTLLLITGWSNRAGRRGWRGHFLRQLCQNL